MPAAAGSAASCAQVESAVADADEESVPCHHEESAPHWRAAWTGGRPPGAADGAPRPWREEVALSRDVLPAEDDPPRPSALSPAGCIPLGFRGGGLSSLFLLGR